MPYSKHLKFTAQWKALGHWDYRLRVQAWEMISGQKCVTDQGNISWDNNAAMNAAWSPYLTDFGGKHYGPDDAQPPNNGAELPLPKPHSDYDNSRKVRLTAIAGTQRSLVIEIDLILPPGELMAIDKTFVFDAIPAGQKAKLAVALYRS